MLLDILLIIAIFIIPPYLVYSGIIKIEKRRLVLAGMCLTVFIILLFEKWTLNDLGIVTNNLRQFLLPYVLATILGVLFLIFLGWALKKQPERNWFANKKFMVLVVPMCVAQEFIFRGYLMPELFSINSSVLFVVIVNALIFTWLHIIYKDLRIILPLSFISGIFFALMYFYYPNLILISLLHAVLNPLAIYLGFFRIKSPQN